MISKELTWRKRVISIKDKTNAANGFIGQPAAILIGVFDYFDDLRSKFEQVFFK
jgi:hypothetical protein